MAMRKAVVAGAGMAALLAGAAVAAPAGAPQNVAMQSGAWGPGGWQAGGAAPMAAPAYAPPPADAGPPMEPPAYRPMPPHGDYKPVHPGQKLKGEWRDPGLTVQDWQGWGLGRPGPGMRWIRYYDDAVLVDDRDRVVDVAGGIDWDVPHRRGPRGYEAGAPGPMRDGPMHGGWHHPPIQPGVSTYRAGPNTTVTTQVIAPPIVYQGGYAPAYGGGYGGGYGYAGGSTVIVSPSVVTTTTTTTTETVWHKVRAKRGCRCARPTPHGKLLRR